MRMTVNPIRCDGRGLCAVLLPELVTLDDWGYPVIEQADVPAHLEAQARRAASACPVLALSLTCVASPRPARSISPRSVALR